jgi:hypothetical protein
MKRAKPTQPATLKAPTGIFFRVSHIYQDQVFAPFHLLVPVLLYERKKKEKKE